MQQRCIVMAAGSILGLTACDVECPPGSVSVESRCLSPEAAAALDGGVGGDAQVPQSPDGGTAADSGMGSRDGSFSTGDAAAGLTLLGLEVSAGELDPPFSSDVRSYTVVVPTWISSLRLAPRVSEGAAVTVMGKPSESEGWSEQVGLEMPDTTISVVVTKGDSESFYDVNVERREPVTVELTASNDDADGDAFGGSLALTADGRTLAVTAHLDDGREGSPSSNDQNESGAVFVFERMGDEWVEVAYLKAPDAPAAFFGPGLSFSPDGNTLVAAGIRLEGNPACSTSSVCTVLHLFNRQRDRWVARESIALPDSTTTTLVSQTRWSLDLERLSVAISLGETLIYRRESPGWRLEARIPGRGQIVGTGSRMVTGSDAGIEVFDRAGTVWSSVSTLAIPPALEGNLSAFSISRDGDVIALGNGEAESSDGIVSTLQSTAAGWITSFPIRSGLSSGRYGAALQLVNQADTVLATAAGAGGWVSATNQDGWEVADTVQYDPSPSSAYSWVLSASSNGTAVAVSTPDEKVYVSFVPGSD